jgi:hypothetical protein
MSPRTTVTLDEDVAELLNRAVRERGISFKQAINDAVRAGVQASPVAAKPFKIKARPMGLRKDLNWDKALDIAAALDDEAMLEVLRREP